MSAAAIQDELKETAEGIDAARGLVKSGQTVDLAGLEARVADICARIPSVAAKDRQRLKPTLVAIIDGLSNLADALTRQRDGIEGELRDVSARQRAVSAYAGGRKAAAKPKKK